MKYTLFQFFKYKFDRRSFEDRPRPPLEELGIKDVAEWRETEGLDELVEKKTNYLKKLTSSQDFDSKCQSYKNFLLRASDAPDKRS